jgi:TfoX/Sxy family transcriptional regulator of competence genes
MVYDEGLAQRGRELIDEHPGYAEKKMFGGIGFLLNGNMACGVNQENLIVRVGAEAYADALSQPHVEIFDINGRAMTGWVMVKEPGYRPEADLRDWVEKGSEFSLTLPVKLKT